MGGSKSKKIIVLAGIYAAALALSHGFRWSRPDVTPADSASEGPRRAISIQAMGEDGPLAGTQTELSILAWPSRISGTAAPPVLLLHGSPGSASNFSDLGPALAERGWDVYALDLPGFGESRDDAPSYSIRAHAHAAHGVLRALRIDRAHVVAWSMGGGVALHLADGDPSAVASLSLIASIGVQRAEGSGSYYFEHVKYGLGYAGLVLLAEAVPDFGLLGDRGRRRSFIRNFWDTDQRPLRRIMQRLETPTLILHGRDDFLVPGWAAATSHELISSSRRIAVDGGHFLPVGGDFGRLPTTLEHLEPFLRRHDREGVPEQRDFVDLTRPRLGLEPFTVPRRVPWWAQFAILSMLASRLPRSTAGITGLLIATLQADAGVGCLACCLGRSVRESRSQAPWVARSARAAAGAFTTGLTTLLALAIGGLFVGSLPVLRPTLPVLLLISLAALGIFAVIRATGGKRST